jgi:hypothetical protein
VNLKLGVVARFGLSLFVVIGLAGVGCRQGSDTAPEIARSVARVAAIPDQERLWREAADQGLAVGLERLSIIDRPVVSRRQPGTAAPPSPRAGQPPPPPSPGGGQQPSQAPPLTIPPEIDSQIRIVSAPPVGSGFTGAATVVAAADDQLTLALGQAGNLVVLARAGKKPIPVIVGKEEVRLAYSPRRSPRAADEMLVIRTASGKGIGRVVQTGAKPITLTVPFYGVVATQVDVADPWSVNVRVSGVPPRILPMGTTVQLGNLFVRLVGAYARSEGRKGPAGGAPYQINILVWSP